jgi:hypothetical protein
MSVVNVWVGATTEATATVVAKVTGSAVRLAVADNPGLSSPAYFGPVTPTAQGIVRLAASGLSASTRYYYALEEDTVLDTTYPGQFRTHPPSGAPSTFTVGMASCAGSSSQYPGVGNVLVSGRLSNHPIFDTIRTKALDEDWLLFIHGGDLHYYDIGSGVQVPNHDLATYRRAYDDVLLQPRQHALYRNVPTVYMYDDHDFGPDNSDSSAPGRDNAVQVYQERVPHYPRGSALSNDPNHHSFEIGRVLFVIWDVRADRVPNTVPPGPAKTMLGTGQKAWFESVLASSDAELLVLVNPSQWDTSTFADSWAGYEHERAELVAMLAAPGGDTSKDWLPRMCLVQGDHHALGMSSTSAWGGFPVFQFAPIDSGPGGSQPWRDVGSLPGRGLYGTLHVDDTGSQITVTATGWSGTTAAMRYTMIVGDGIAPRAVQNTQSTLYTAVNNTYGTQSTSGGYSDCVVVFTAPESGRAMIHWSGGVRNIAAASGPVAYLSPEIRAGATAGVGTVLLAADDTRSVRTNLAGNETVRAGASHTLVTGLTPGAAYNVRILHRVTSQTGEFFQRGLLVAPAS